MEVVEQKELVGTPLARSILRRYMADYTVSTSAPSKVKSGAYAIVMKDSGEVWLGETASFSTTLIRFRNRRNIAHCIDEALKRGSDLEIWLLTQPDRFSIDDLHDALEDSKLLATRKPRSVQGPGVLYCVRHDLSTDYFVTSARTKRTSAAVLSQYLRFLMKQRNDGTNVGLSQFIDRYTSDIVRGTGFTIAIIDTFENREEENVKRQTYIDNCKYGNNLNYVLVD